MEWSDVGIVLGAKRHGESSAILELMTQEHGRHLGLVRGGGASRLRPMLQPGNLVSVVWRARLDEHLGHYAVEGLDLRAAGFLDVAHALYGITHLAALCRLLPERDPHLPVYEALEEAIVHLCAPASVAALMARFELSLLSELGFGLDLSCCAATGASAELIYVSPRSGRAVSRAAGEPWRDRLLALPAFLSDETPAPQADDLLAAFTLTEFFLMRHVYEPRGLPLPQARAQFITAVGRALKKAA